MKNLQDLQQFIRNLGWFSGRVKLLITLESEFEGFYGKASESWERRVTIEIVSPDVTMLPSVKVVGRRFQDIDGVAQDVLSIIKHKKK